MTKTPDRARLMAMQRHFYTATTHSWPATVVGATATSVDGETAIADSLVESFKDGFLLSRGVLHPSPLCCGCLSATDFDFYRPDSVCTPQLNGWLAPAQWHIVRVFRVYSPTYLAADGNGLVTSLATRPCPHFVWCLAIRRDPRPPWRRARVQTLRGQLEWSLPS